MSKPPLQVDLLDLDGVLDSLAGRMRDGKFVLINNAGRYCLVAGTTSEFHYHARLVEEYCRRHGIAMAWLKEPEKAEIKDGGVAVVGGGLITREPSSGVISLYGSSKAYGGCCRATLEQVTTALTQTSGHKFSVEPECSL